MKLAELPPQQLPLRVTLKVIAARLNVSHATVSLALKGSTRISEKRKEQVRTMAQEMGYRPDPFLSSLVAYRHKLNVPAFKGVIAWLVCPGDSDSAHRMPQLHECRQGVQAAMERSSFKLEEFVWQPEVSAGRMFQILYSRGIRGLIVPSETAISPSRHADAARFPWQDFEIVRISPSIPDGAASVVFPDQAHAALLALQVLDRKGYKRVGLVCPEDPWHRPMAEGYIASAQMLRRQIPPVLVLPQAPDGDGEAPLQQLEAWLSCHEPDAILTADPRLPQMLKSLDLRSPQDIGVFSADLASTPELATGLRTHYEEAGRLAAEMLVTRLTSFDLDKRMSFRRVLLCSSTWQDL